MPAMLKTAMGLAEKAHEGQFRNDKVTPYFSHVKDVVSRVKSEKGKLVAALHDALEDTPLKEADLLAAGLPQDVVDGVKAMTKPNSMPYLEYIKTKILPNELAREVKKADIEANLADNPNERQVKKYTEALKLLG